MFLATPGDAHIVLLGLCLGINPGRLRGPYGVSGIEPGSSLCEASVLPDLLFLQPLKLMNDSLRSYSNKKYV